MAALLGAALTGCGGDGRSVAHPQQPLPETPPCPTAVTASGAGARLPDVTLRCLGRSSEVALKQLPAGPTVVNLWASWCVPCRKEAPVLERVHQAAGEGVLFLGIVTQDEEDSARAFMQDFGMTYPSLYDRSRTTLGQLAAPGLPVTLVLAADGTVLQRTVGGIGQDELVAALRRAGVRLDQAVLDGSGGR